jgi:hypothetical protein
LWQSGWDIEENDFSKWAGGSLPTEQNANMLQKAGRKAKDK